jgi:NAD(P)-dependent dehydrogenase (short-subunit alcohol dehydrogenase family)
MYSSLGAVNPNSTLPVKLIERYVTGICSDVSNLADLDCVYAAIKNEKGRFDILFASAGGGGLAPLKASQTQDWMRDGYTNGTC